MFFFFTLTVQQVQTCSNLQSVNKQTNSESYPLIGKLNPFLLGETATEWMLLFPTRKVSSASISCNPSLLENDTNAILVSFSSVVSMTTSVVRAGLCLLPLLGTSTSKIQTHNVDTCAVHFPISVFGDRCRPASEAVDGARTP